MLFIIGLFVLSFVSAIVLPDPPETPEVREGEKIDDGSENNDGSFTGSGQTGVGSQAGAQTGEGGEGESLQDKLIKINWLKWGLIALGIVILIVIIVVIFALIKKRKINAVANQSIQTTQNNIQTPPAPNTTSNTSAIQQ